MSEINGISKPKKPLDLKELFLAGYNQKQEEEEDKFLKEVKSIQKEFLSSQKAEKKGKKTETDDATDDSINPFTGQPVYNVMDVLYRGSDGNLYHKDPENTIDAAENDNNSNVTTFGSFAREDVLNKILLENENMPSATANTNESRVENNKQNSTVQNFTAPRDATPSSVTPNSANISSKYISQANMHSYDSSKPVNMYV